MTKKDYEEVRACLRDWRGDQNVYHRYTGGRQELAVNLCIIHNVNRDDCALCKPGAHGECYRQHRPAS
jgi:hypothetical protein